MGGYIDPITGNLRGYGGAGNPVTPEMRALAQEKDAWSVAEKVYEWAKNPEGGKWFTRWKLNLTPSQMSIVHRAVDLGIFRKDHEKQWWKHTHLTWPWLLTAMALRDEWNKSPEAEAIRRAIIPNKQPRQPGSITG